jgi:putative transposase
MRNPLQRFYGQGDLHFVTFSCYARRSYLGTPDARTEFIQVLDEVRSRHKFQLLGYVVMPEHVHMVISEPKTGNPSKSMQMLKQTASRRLKPWLEAPSAMSPSAAFSGEDTQPFWQRRFYDFNVWSSQKLQEKLDYMHGNPVQRTVVQHPADWPWSSWSYCEKGEQGLIRVDHLFEEGSPRPNDDRKSQNPHP